MKSYMQVTKLIAHQLQLPDQAPAISEYENLVTRLDSFGLSAEEFTYPISDVHIHKALEALNFWHDTHAQAEVSFVNLADLMQIPIHVLNACIWCAYAGRWELGSADFDNFGV